MGGREQIGEGETLTHTINFSQNIVCVGIHCRGHFTKKRETDIKQFVITVPVRDWGLAIF